MLLKNIVSIIALGAFILIAFGSSGNGTSTSTSNSSGSGAQAPAIKQYLSDQCPTVASAFSAGGGLTELQQKETWKSFEGKWVRWTGKVSHVGESFGTLQVQIKCLPSTLTSDAIISFNDEWKNSLLQLREGQTIRFEARLNDYSTIMGVISLGDGSLL